MRSIQASNPVSSIALRRVTASMSHSNNSEFDRVCRAAQNLKSLERDILAMSAGRGLLIGDIAALLGISERRVERLLARALYKFDRALERELRPRWLFW